MKPTLIWSDAGQALEIWRVPVKLCKEQDRNAQILPPDMMERLTETVKRDGRLESIPFAVRRGEGDEMVMEVISGHHRLRAARAAGLDDILVLADSTNMRRSAVVAKQIAHNAITGASDPQVLAQMLEEIDNENDLLESFVDPELLPKVEEEVGVPDMVELEEEWRTVTFVFLEEHLTEFTEIMARLDDETNMVGTISMDQFELFQRTVARVASEAKTVNVGACVVAMCKMVLNQLEVNDGG